MTDNELIDLHNRYMAQVYVLQEEVQDIYVDWAQWEYQSDDLNALLERPWVREGLEDIRYNTNLGELVMMRDQYRVWVEEHAMRKLCQNLEVVED